MARAIIWIVLLPLICLTPAHAETPEQFVNRLIRTLGPASMSPEAARQTIPQALSKFVDVGQMAHKALGFAWDRLDEVNQTKYLVAYEALLTRALLQRVRFGWSHAVILGSRLESNGIDIVFTRIVLPNKSEHDIEWYVDNGLDRRVVDIAVDGILVTDAQAREFSAIVAVHAGDLTALPVAIDHISQ